MVSARPLLQFRYVCSAVGYCSGCEQRFAATTTASFQTLRHRLRHWHAHLCMCPCTASGKRGSVVCRLSACASRRIVVLIAACAQSLTDSSLQCRPLSRHMTQLSRTATANSGSSMTSRVCSRCWIPQDRVRTIERVGLARVGGAGAAFVPKAMEAADPHTDTHDRVAAAHGAPQGTSLTPYRGVHCASGSVDSVCLTHRTRTFG